VGDIFGFRPLYRRESDTRYKEIYENRAKLSVVGINDFQVLSMNVLDCGLKGS